MPNEKKPAEVIITPAETDRDMLTNPLHAIFPRNSKIGKAVSWYEVGLYAYKSAKKGHEFYQTAKWRRDKYTVKISSWDELELYTLVFKWVAENVGDNVQLSNYDLVTNYTKRRYRVLKAGSGGNRVNIEMGGAPVTVILDQEETNNNNVVFLRRDITIRCRTQEDTDKVVEFISELYDEDQNLDAAEEATPVNPYRVWNSSYWNNKKFVSRTKESVILSGTQREDLFTDIDMFLGLKPKYLKTNIPWHRGYLFYGPPGTGKTSLALAVASTFELPVYFLSLTQLEGDKDLSRAISTMEHSEAVLILEDVDVAQGTHKREDDSDTPASKVTLAGLLNTLDGVDTPSGLITIMTTNHIERLDDALIRPGRMDHKIFVNYLDDDQLKRMLMWYLDIEINDLPKIECDISPADITGVVKAYLGFPELCEQEVRNFIREANAASA